MDAQTQQDGPSVKACKDLKGEGPRTTREQQDQPQIDKSIDQAAAHHVVGSVTNSLKRILENDGGDEEARNSAKKSARLPAPLPLTRSSSTPVSRVSPPFKKASFRDFNSVLRRSYSITIDEELEMGGDFKGSKIINDNIHGHMVFPEVAMLLVDTPQFQRLRNLKQLGMSEFVFPSSNHARFQHSLGVAHLAQKFALELRTQRPDLVDEKDVHCVMLAGLCHDLGHGPWSHFWEGYVKSVNDEVWHHEDTSIQMLDHLLDSNNLRPKLASLGIEETDILFIKELIAGPIDPSTGLPLHPTPPIQPWPYRGRPENKGFLYEIVANKENGIDVDKWDYFLRDDQALKIGITFFYERFIATAKLLRADEAGSKGRHRICIRDKEAENLREMFMDRARLHRHGYQHRVTKTIDVMMTDALKLADGCIRIKGSGGNLYPLSQCHRDIVAYEKLTDSVFQKILESDSQEAIDIINRIQKRDLYKKMAEIKLVRSNERHSALLDKTNDLRNTDIVRQEILDRLNCSNGHSSGDQADPNDLFVMCRRVTCGQDSENPQDKVPFYYISGSGELRVGAPIPVDLSLPESPMDRTLWICSKSNSKAVQKSFVSAIRSWTEANGLSGDFQN